MDEEEKVAEAVKDEVVEEKIVTTAQSEEAPGPIPLDVGYLVGVKQDGNFVFELLGENKSLVGLAGVHAYGQIQIKKVMEDATMTGDRMTGELAAILNVVNQKLDHLLQLQAQDSEVSE